MKNIRNHKTFTSLLSRVFTNSRINNHQCRFPYFKHFDDKKYIFIHIPRTGGTSITELLNPDMRGRLHVPWSTFYQANPKKFHSYYKFSVVRHPYAKVYSSFKYLLSGGNQKDDLELARALCSYTDFSDFIVNGLSASAIRYHPLFQPQSYFIFAWSGKKMVDKICKLEKLEEDFSEVSQALNLGHITIPHLNKSNCLEDTDHAKILVRDKEIYDIFMTFYGVDFDLLGYERN